MALTMEDLASAAVGKTIATTTGESYTKLKDGWWTDEKAFELRERHFVGMASEGKLFEISDLPLQAGQVALDGEWQYLLMEQEEENWWVVCVSNRTDRVVVGKSTTVWLTPRRSEDATVEGKAHLMTLGGLLREEQAKHTALQGEHEALNQKVDEVLGYMEQAEATKTAMRAFLDVPVPTEAKKKKNKKDEKTNDLDF